MRVSCGRKWKGGFPLGASITQLSDILVVCDGGGGGDERLTQPLIAWLVYLLCADRRVTAKTLPLSPNPSYPLAVYCQN
jgi:hypothetical protein